MFYNKEYTERIPKYFNTCNEFQGYMNKILEAHATLYYQNERLEYKGSKFGSCFLNNDFELKPKLSNNIRFQTNYQDSMIYLDKTNINSTPTININIIDE